MAYVLQDAARGQGSLGIHGHFVKLLTLAEIKYGRCNATRMNNIAIH
jgi:hypothetical protein